MSAPIETARLSITVPDTVAHFEAMRLEREAAFRAERRLGIGSSDVPKITGLSRWGTALDVWLEKTGRIEDESGEAAEWGRILEPVLLRQYARRRGVCVLGREEDGAPTLWTPIGEAVPVNALGAVWLDAATRLLGLIRHPTHPYMIAHVDAYEVEYHESGPVPVAWIEAKTANEWLAREWGDEDTDDVPPAYNVQVQHQGGILAALGIELPVCRMPVLLGGQRFQIAVVPRSDIAFASLAKIARKFWKDHVETDQRPDPSFDELGRASLKALYPADTGVVIEDDGSYADLVAALFKARAEFKAAEKARTAAEVAFQNRMEDASEVKGPWGKVTWKRTKDSSTTEWESAFIEFKTQVALYTSHDPKLGEALVEAAAECVRQNTQPKPGHRRFLPTPAKK